MGFLKKLFKPVAKVFDKIIPNEIKPALPYLAAFAPMLAPTTGFMGSMMGRALLSGGANIGAQLAQEGNEGDVNLMSTGLASLQGAMGAEGAAKGFRGMKDTMVNPRAADMPAMLGETGYNKLGMLSKAKNFGLEGLAKGSEFIGNAGDILRPGGEALTMSNAITAAGLPFSQGTGDAMAFEANAAMDAYRLALADYDAEQAALGGGTNEGRREAILAAMQAYNHPQELIESTLEELGLKDGGRIGYAGGGITDIFAETSFVEPNFGGVEQAIGNIEQDNELLASRQSDFYMLLEEAMNMGDEDKILEIQSDFYKEFGIPMPMSENTTEESVTQMAAEGGIMGYNMGGNVLPQGMEMDYRGGGFIPMGSKERADDVPARVSKNEFVMTADAVRAAGGGSVNQGAKKMYDLMNNLEARA